MNKKAQITLFIIIGVIILFSSATILVIRNQIDEDKISTEREPVIKEVPSQLKVVQRFVDECIKRSAIEGLTTLGQQGGYVDIDAQAFREVNMHPTESDYVKIFDTVKVPYWYYLRSKNADVSVCEVSSKKPRLRKTGKAKTPYHAKDGSASKDDVVIEAQLEQFVNSQVDSCIGGFGELEERGYHVEKKAGVRTKVTVSEQEVRFLVQMPIEVTYQGSKTDIDDFYVKVPLQLKKTYEMAESIIQAQLDHKFLSRNVKDLIVMYSGLGSTEMMPLSEMQFEAGSGKYWIKMQMKEKMQNILLTWIKGLQVAGTKNYEKLTLDPNVKFKASVRRLYDNMIMPELPGISNYGAYSIRFDYLGWPIYFDLANCNGEMCTAETMGNKFLPLPFEIQNYNAQYDVSYPVIIEIKHPPTIDFKDGYVLRFAIEDNIRTNEPFTCDTVMLEVPVDTSGETLLCNPTQRLSGDYEFLIKDSVTGRGVPDVVLNMDVASEACALGMTDSNGVYKGKLPLVAGAKISAGKKDYITKSVLKSVQQNRGDTVSIDLAPIKELEVDVKKHFMGFEYKEPKLSLKGAFKDSLKVFKGYLRLGLFDTKSIRDSVKQALDQGLIRTGPMKALAKDINLSSTDEIIIQFTRKTDDPLEDDFSTLVHFKYNMSSPPKMRLAPGTYDVTGQLVVSEKRVVPSTQKKVRTKPWKSKKTIPIPGTVLDSPHIWGGIDLKDFEVGKSVVRKDKITLKVLELPVPQGINDMDWLGDMARLSEQNRLLLTVR
jgi:hypothetical protein